MVRWFSGLFVILTNPGRFSSRQRRRAALRLAVVIIALAALAALGVFMVCRLIPGGCGPLNGGLAAEQEAEEQILENSSAVLPETEDAGEEYLEQTLFIGDSNTVRLANFGEIEMNSMAAVVGMGVQSVPDKACIWFEEYSNPVTIPRAAELLQPQRMIITYGTNNTYMSTEEFIEAYEEALDALEESWPYADLIIAAVPPVGEDKEDAQRVQETIDAFNAALLELAEERDLHFLNTSEVLLGEDGYLKSDYVEADGMHLTAEGAEALVKYVRTHSYITEDRRPELQPQPTRIDPPYQPQEDEMEEQEPAVQPTPTPTPTPTPSSSTSSSAASESTSSTTSISEPEQTSEPAQDSSSAQPPQDATPPAGGEDTTSASTPQQSGSEGQEEVK